MTSEWFTDSPVFHPDIVFNDGIIEAVLLDGSCFCGKLEAELEENYVLNFYLYADNGFVDFEEIEKWRLVE